MLLALVQLCSDKTGTLTLNKMVIQVGSGTRSHCVRVHLHTANISKVALAFVVQLAGTHAAQHACQYCASSLPCYSSCFSWQNLLACVCWTRVGMLLATLQDDCPIYTPGVTKDDVLTAAALAAKWKEPPRDALDTLVSASAATLGLTDSSLLTSL